MEYEYREISQEKAEIINSKGFVNNIGKKICINSIKSVTNKDETVIFRQTWFSHENEVPSEYFFIYRKTYYFIDIFRREIWEEEGENCKYWCFKYDIVKIYNTQKGEKEYSIEEILKVLKEVLYVNSEHIGKRNDDDRTKIIVMYKGEEI